jgi:CheY-like chemotaxis protein
VTHTHFPIKKENARFPILSCAVEWRKVYASMGEPRAILIVEDSPDDLLLIRRAFERGQIANPVHVVFDGEQAISYLAGENAYADRARFPLPALVLLDLRLPRKSGFEVLKWIRGHGELSRLPVVVLSTSHAENEIGRAYDLGANSYLVKPVSTEALTRLVQAMDFGWMRHTTPPPPDARPFA